MIFLLLFGCVKGIAARVALNRQNCDGLLFLAALSHRLEVVLPHVMGDFVAEHGSLHVGGAKVYAAPHASVDDLLGRVGEPLKGPCRTGFVAERAEGNLVCAEEVLECVHERGRRGGVPRGVVREGRREERWQVADRCRWVEQRQPRRIGLGVRVAVGVGFPDRRYRPPELPIILVVPAADRGISRG